MAAIIFSGTTALASIADPPAGSGLILRPFDRPTSMFGVGHRGVDLQAAELDLVRSPISGEVHFAGYVVDRPVITISTGSILMSMEPVDSFRFKGDRILRGEIIGIVARGGHCDQRCLHVGVRRINSRYYLDPIPYLLQLPRLLAAKP
jgi:hypothetical protein